MANELIAEAIQIAGGQTALAKRCGKRQGHVWFWLNSERVTAETAVLIDAATNGGISKERLRPDIFGPAREEAA